MSGQAVVSDAFWPLLDAACDSTLGEAQVQELATLLSADSTARKVFVDHMCLRRNIRSFCRVEMACDAGLAQVRAILPQTTLPRSPVVGFPFLFKTIHGTVGFFSQELPFSLLIATLLTGFGLWIASLIYVSSPEKIAKDSLLPAKSSVHSTLNVVGKITGMVDCRWADPQTETFNGANVLLDRRYALRSGLMEITYDTGAKVILQGPVTYEVESKNGGFLPVGKLTGKVEVETAKGFVVRTPTAIVTDLGTEFAVEVGREGHTISHVFRGSVELRTISATGKAKSAVCVLHENDSAQVSAVVIDRNSLVGEIRPIQLDARRFVRTIASTETLPMRVMAWFRLGEDDPGAVVGRKVTGRTVNSNGSGFSLYPRINPTYSDNVPPTGSSLSVHFDGDEDECLANTYTPYRITDHFVLEAWVCPRKIEKYPQFIVYNGDPNHNGFGLLVFDGRWQFLISPTRLVDSGVPAVVGRWTHLAMVCVNRRAQLWINGRPAGKPFDGSPFVPDKAFVIGCEHVHNPRMAFNGEIDEVRLLQLSGDFNPQWLLFYSSSPTGEKGGRSK